MQPGAGFVQSGYFSLLDCPVCIPEDNDFLLLVSGALETFSHKHTSEEFNYSLCEKKEISAFPLDVYKRQIHSLAATNEVCTLPVFRPVIGFDKQEIVDVALKINTYETSILPYEDCCTIFVAKHPVTKPNLQVIKRSEEKLQDKIEEMLKEAVETAETIICE